MKSFQKFKILEDFILSLGLPWGVDYSLRFDKYLNLVLEEREKQRLIGPDNPDEIIQYHFLDSLQALKFQKPHAGEKWLDLGSGAGLPGIPIAILNPLIQIHLLESSLKRVSFLRRVKVELSLNQVEILENRSEELAHKQGFCQSYNVVLARAVAILPSLIELSLPFLIPGGLLLAYKGPKGIEEIKSSTSILKKLGGIVENSIPYQLDDKPSGLHLIPIIKTK